MTDAEGDGMSEARAALGQGESIAGAVPTLRDVARRAQVHPSTASRALDPRTRSLVKAETAQRVLEAAEELQYHPNSLARGLKMNRSSTIGVLIPDLTNPLFPPIVRGIEEELSARGYTAILASTDNDEEKERSIIEVMRRNRRVDGLILATASRQSPLLEELLAQRIPMVLVNRTTDRRLLSSVTANDYEGVKLAVRHLVSLGHTAIAHVAGPQNLTTALARYRAFVSSMEREGLTAVPDHITFAEQFQAESGAQVFSRLLERGRPFTAVFAANDLIALGCYSVLRKRGLCVPEDISIVGYNDIPFSDQFDPPLTTVRIPHRQMGVEAAKLLLAQIEQGRGASPALHVLPSLVIRSSTAPLNASRTP